MPNTNNPATVWNAPNYVGELFLVGQNQTPFLNMIGGLSGGKQVNSWEFPLDQNYALESASQPAITETDSLTAPTAWTYVRAQEVNTCQIFQQAVSVSYAKQSDRGALSGLSILGQQPVGNEKDFQIQAALKQIAVNAEHTFLNGAYQKATDSGTAAKTRGIITACTVNTVDASAADFSKALLDALLKEMADNGASFNNMVLFANSFQVQAISDVYGYAPESATVGGVAIKKILTDFCELGVVYAPKVPAATILVANMDIIAPVFLPVPNKGYLFYEELARTGASEKGQIYGQIGLAYGYAGEHGTLTNLSTS